MPATIKPTFMLLSSPDTCLLTLPFPFFTRKPSRQSLSFPTKPINLLRLLKPKPHCPSFASFASQTSDWSQEEEEEEKINPWTLTELENQESEGPTWESPGLGEPEARVSNWEPEGGEFGFVEPPEEAKVFIGNLPYEVDSESLAMLFEKAGTVEIAEVIYNRETDTSRGFGFVTMSTVEEAEKAVDMFHQFDMEGRLLTVNKAAPRGSRPERPPRVNGSGYRIYVGNLPWDVDNGRLEQVFSEHGKVVNARVVFDRDTGRSRGFGFVTMSSETEMNDAIAALDGQSLEGRAIRVNVAEERPRPNF